MLELVRRWVGRRHDSARHDLLRSDEIVFLICVESNRLEPQALLLCQSIRAFGGRYRDAPIVAVSPRAGLEVGAATKAALQELSVTCVSEPLNQTGSSYGTINRIVAGAWAEKALPQPYIAVLDTDTVFVSEPSFVRADAGIRPVDTKGSASSGPGDPVDAYWLDMLELAGLDPEKLPLLRTTIDNQQIRASYNGGFTVVRRELGILQKTEEIFLAALSRNLRPFDSSRQIRASTGMVPDEVSQWWGSSQAALSMAIWSKTADVRTYDSRYNIPLHALVDGQGQWECSGAPVLLHYHYLAEPEFQSHLLKVMERLSCSSTVRGWIERRLSLFEIPEECVAQER